MRKLLPFILCFTAYAQTPGLVTVPVTLPDAPAARAILNPKKEVVHPFAFSYSISDRLHTPSAMPMKPSTGLQNDVTFGVNGDWRLNDNRQRMGIAYSYTPASQVQAITFSISNTLLTFGHRK